MWLAPVRDPLPLLTDLLRLYRCGQRAPLPFFAYASRAFAEKMASPKAPRGAWEAAREKFTPSEFRPSDGGDPYVAEIWRNGLPCDAEARGDITFTSVAQTVYAPFFSHRELRT